MPANNPDKLDNLIVNFPQCPRLKSYTTCPTHQKQAVAFQPKQQMRQQVKRVRFANTSSLHRGYYTVSDDDSEQSSTWYSKSEYKKFHKTLKSDIKAMKEVTSGRAEKESLQDSIFTGIEQFASKDVLRKTVDYRIAHRDAVLAEYRWQDTRGIVDLKRLSSISKKLSKWGKIKALILAGNQDGTHDWGWLKIESSSGEENKHATLLLSDAIWPILVVNVILI